MSEDNNNKPTLKDKFVPTCADDCPMEELELRNFKSGPCCDNLVRKSSSREVPRSEFH